MFTKQPYIMLSDDEADRLTPAVCDVLDLHKINVTEAGGNGGLYLTLIVTVFGVYKPKLVMIKNGGGQQIEQAAPPPTPGAVPPGGKEFRYDFSNDIH